MTDSPRELEALAAIDSVTTTSKPWELTVTSRYLVKVSWFAVAVVLAVHIFMAVVVDIGDTGAAVTPIDKFAFIGIGLIIAFFAYHLRRPRVRANADGVEVRNFIGTRFYPWSVIYGLSFPKGDRMARLELPEFEYVPMWAFQSGDGQEVVAKVNAFRDLEDKYMPED
ncbi:PH domain-containing protein [Corynebacterium epidermidicanis]|uniref:Bacterial PH domain n=1 Tax=Corynebacterium epidermidicanis TaxID=1050174 RepID=A0A0G3GWL5_9CORY|nr:PH domain-containing protein [Corynebacterium epidermidicanis]AKK03217.1 Bacterial PH domain [Corynebacterium epidermidicanis]